MPPESKTTMCLIIQTDIQDDFLAQHKKDDVVVCYKSLVKTKKNLYSRYYPKSSGKWEVGVKNSNREYSKLHESEKVIVNNGIHVFLNKEDADRVSHPSLPSVTIEAHCYMKDFVAAGVYSVDMSTPTAVFNKVSLLAFPKEVEVLSERSEQLSLCN